MVVVNISTDSLGLFINWNSSQVITYCSASVPCLWPTVISFVELRKMGSLGIDWQDRRDTETTS